MPQTSQQSQPKNSSQPKFGGLKAFAASVVAPEARNQFVQDTAGVWLPKAPVSYSRSKLQFFEDTFLEFVEDGAFYFTIPVMGTAMAALISKTQQSLGFFAEDQYKRLGQTWKQLGYEQAGKALVDTKLVAAKSGAVAGALASAAAFEYMIQHWKNVITAKKFKTTNFTGVAGLEQSRTQTKQGESDPVAKANRRGLQVGALWLGAVLGSAFVLPQAIVRLSKQETMRIPKLLRYFNFNSKAADGKKIAVQFDTNKAFQGVLTLVGLASYLDASRDKLEFKEQATRLSVVIPYLLFGQALAGNLLGKVFDHTIRVKGADGKKRTIAEHGLSLLDKKPYESILKAMWNKGTMPETFLNLKLAKEEGFLKEVSEKVASGHLTNEAKTVLARWQKHGLGLGSLAMGAAVCGIGINLIAYHQTKERFKKQQAQKPQLALQSVQPMQGQVVHQSYGGFAAQGKPLQDPASAARPVSRPQAPFGGARVTGNPYGYGQWRV